MKRKFTTKLTKEQLRIMMEQKLRARTIPSKKRYNRKREKATDDG